MLSSLLSSTVFMVGSGSVLGSLLLIAYLMMNETIPVKKSKQELKSIFSPIIVSLLIVFVSTVVFKVVSIL